MLNTVGSTAVCQGSDVAFPESKYFSTTQQRASGLLDGQSCFSVCDKMMGIHRPWWYGMLDERPYYLFVLCHLNVFHKRWCYSVVSYTNLNGRIQK